MATDDAALATLESRAIGKDGTGANLVQEGWSNQVWLSLVKTISLLDREIVTFIPKQQGIGEVKVTATKSAHTAALVAEHGDMTGAQDIVFEDVTLTTYKYSSKWRLSSWELMQDSPPYRDELLPRFLAAEVARGLTVLYTGTGTNEPEGIVTGAGDSAVTGTAAVATWLSLMASVDAAYHGNGTFFTNPANLATAMADAAFSNIQSMFRIVSSSAVPANRLVFGDPRAFYVHASQPQIIENTEHFALTGQVGHASVVRVDSKVVDDSALQYATIT